jgi:MSHA biogenesis protein MshJ
VSGLWQRYAARINALSLRERVMVFAAVMVAVVALGYTLMIEPEVVKHKRTTMAMLQKDSEMKAFEAQLMKLVGAGGQGAQRTERERMAAMRADLARLEARITAEERRFTAPSQMRAVVEGLLARNRGVALVEMKTLAAETVVPDAKGAAAPAAKPAAAAAKPAARERLIYRHGVELRVTGSYLDLLGYARELEKLPTPLYWGTLELDAAAYPKVSMKLTVYTLSLDPAWLSV